MTNETPRVIPIPRFKEGVVMPPAEELREAICDPSYPASDLFKGVAEHARLVAKELDERPKQVVTWMTPNGGHYINLCKACEERLKNEDDWPREVEGEYCQVHYGLHDGECDGCTGLIIEGRRRPR